MRNRPILFGVLLFALFSVLFFNLTIDWLTSDHPNYSRIEEGLFLGGDVITPPPGTQAVLNLCHFKDSYSVEFYTWEPIRDAAPVPKAEWLRKQVDWIDTHRKAGRKVYVHCQQGASRSPMVVIAYLMDREGWSRDQALRIVKSKRSEVNPNPAFMEFLLEWEKKKVLPEGVGPNPVAKDSHGPTLNK